MHTVHPDPHTHGLADDCPRCAEHAERLADLDEMMIADLVGRTVDRACGQPRERRSITELVAETSVLNTLERVGRLAECAPEQVARYLNERWHLGVTITGRQ